MQDREEGGRIHRSTARLTDGEQCRSITTFQSRVGVASNQGENWFFVLKSSPKGHYTGCPICSCTWVGMTLIPNAHSDLPNFPQSKKNQADSKTLTIKANTTHEQMGHPVEKMHSIFFLGAEKITHNPSFYGKKTPSHARRALCISKATLSAHFMHNR